MLGERYGWSRSTDPAQPIPPGTTVADLKSMESSTLLTTTFDQGAETYAWVDEHRERSITELEILHNFLLQHERGEKLEPSQAQFARAYLRTARREDMRDTPLASEQLDDLKARIRASPVAAADYTDAEQLGDIMYEDLVRMLDRTYPPNEHYSPRDAENDAMLFFGQELLSAYVHEEELQQACRAHFEGAPAAPLVLVGAAGSGKSATAAHLASALETWLPVGQKSCVIVHHVGASANSTSPSALMRRILLELKHARAPGTAMTGSRGGL